MDAEAVGKVIAGDATWAIENAEVLDFLRSLPDECVHCVVTSPPYWGLRDYGTAKWEGGDPKCDHDQRRRERDVDSKSASNVGSSRDGVAGKDRCRKCGANRIDDQIGLEESPDEYVAKIVEVFREVRRVLRNDGVLFLNLGDSYSGGKTGRSDNDVKTRVKMDRHGHGSGKKIQNKGNDGVQQKPPVGLSSGNLVGIPWRVAFALQDDGWILRQDIIWCLSGGAQVYARTKKGIISTMIKDLVRLDPASVELWNGEKWTRVKSFTRTHRPDDPLEIELRSGERIGCTPGHVWPTARGDVRASDLRIGDVLKTTRLPSRKKPHQPAGIPDEVGWLVGFYLAEGNITDKDVRFSMHKKEMHFVERLRSFATMYHAAACTDESDAEGLSLGVTISGKIVRALVKTYISGRTSKNKRLTNACWRRSDGFLRQLLQGYLDGDGHYDEQNDRWRIGFTNNDGLAQDLRTVAARLGFFLKLKRCLHGCNGKSFPGWKGELRYSQSGHWNCKPISEIVAIRTSRARQFWDIEVEDDPHLYALASGVLTHNSKPGPMPESVKNRCTKAHEYVFLLAKQKGYFWDGEAIKEKQKSVYSSSSFLPDSDKDQYGDRTAATSVSRINRSDDLIDGYANKRSVWTVGYQPWKEAHFATFPPKLIVPMIKAGTSERGCCLRCGASYRRIIKNLGYSRASTKKMRGNAKDGSNNPHNQGDDINKLGGVWETQTVGWEKTCDCKTNKIIPCLVLDPFSGAGTTVMVSRRLRRRGIGCDLNGKYVKMARRRVKMDSPLFN